MDLNLTNMPPNHAFKKRRASFNSRLKRNEWTTPTYYAYEHNVYYDGVPDTPIVVHERHYSPENHQQLGPDRVCTYPARRAIYRRAGTYISVMAGIAVTDDEYIDCDKDFGEG